MGTLAGGNSLGETIRNGIGCLVVIFSVVLARALAVLAIKDRKRPASAEAV